MGDGSINLVPEYLPRLVDPLLAELLAELPAVSVVGPRASGKTTTAERHARSVIRLDRPAEALAVAADPDAALAGLAEPILLDEWQEVPQVLGAVKRACDADPSPGRFLLTGSVRAEMQTATWPGTGRVTRLTLLPFTEGELRGSTQPPLIDRIADGMLGTEEVRGRPGARSDARSGADTSSAPARTDADAPPATVAASLRDDCPNLPEYIEMAIRGGFPPAQHMASERVRRSWLSGYIDEIVSRDAAAAGSSPDSTRLRSYFRAYALHSGGVTDDLPIYEAAGIDRRTALAYRDLLTRIHVVADLPAWSSNRLKRLTRMPKRLVVDPSLLAAVTRASVRSVMGDADLLGRLLETFVTAQLRAQATVSEHGCELHHLRHHSGRHEIDVVAEVDARHVVGFEIKATAAPSSADARHLAWLRDEMGEQFLAGAVLHTGPGAYQLGNRIWALPICSLWQT